jgi:DNA-binding response OmpR family regulator
MSPPSAVSPLNRILLVEDDTGVQDLLRDLLEAEGYRVLSAASPLDAVDISQLYPSLVILDLWFGGRASGWDLLEALHVTPGARGIPVMICTADARMVQREADRLVSLAATVLLKPFDVDDLLARVGAVCSPSTTPRPRHGSVIRSAVESRGACQPGAR